MCVCAAAAGWKYQNALEELGTGAGEGLAFICRWVELHEPRERSSSGVCAGGGGGRKEGKRGAERERNHDWNCVFVASDVIKGRSEPEAQSAAGYTSQGGRLSFDLDLSLHSLHAERI